MAGRSGGTHRQKPQLLVNYLRHAGTHNKVLEEREMWRLRELELKAQYEKVQRPERGTPLTRGRLLSDTLVRESRSPSPAPKDRRGEECAPSDCYWTRQLMKAEERDPFRWGHSGYKELYPEEFDSADEEGGDRKRKRRTKSSSRPKTMKDGELDKKKRRKRGRRDDSPVPKSRKRRRRKKARKDDTASSSSDGDVKDRRGTLKTKLQKRTRRKDKKLTYGPSQGSSSEQSDSERRRKPGAHTAHLGRRVAKEACRNSSSSTDGRSSSSDK